MYISHDVKGDDAGFTLLEVLVALMIFSIITLATFQSTVQLLSLSERVDEVSVELYNSVIDHATYDAAISGLIAGSDTDPATLFSGTQAGFRGLSRGFYTASSGNYNLSTLELLIRQEKLIFKISDEETHSPNLRPAIGFSYLGTDRTWYDNWPSKKPVIFSGRTQSRDHLLMPAPALPLAVRLNFVDGSSWVSAPDGSTRAMISSDLTQ